MGSTMDSRYMTCPGCFQVFDTLAIWGKPFEEYDAHKKVCKKYQDHNERMKAQFGSQEKK